MKDVCFILEMKVGNVYTRWMGTVSSSKRKRCVVLTTIKGKTILFSNIVIILCLDNRLALCVDYFRMKSFAVLLKPLSMIICVKTV